MYVAYDMRVGDCAILCCISILCMYGMYVCFAFVYVCRYVMYAMLCCLCYACMRVCDACVRLCDLGMYVVYARVRVC